MSSKKSVTVIIPVFISELKCFGQPTTSRLSIRYTEKNRSKLNITLALLDQIIMIHILQVDSLNCIRDSKYSILNKVNHSV